MNMATSTLANIIGSTPEELQTHYEGANDFFGVWLDPTMSYSCAMFEPGDSLQQAQIRKLDHHIKNVLLRPGMRLLDIGCGWGAMMARAAETVSDISATGITIAEQQVRYILDRNIPAVDANVAPWTEYEPPHRFDAIISVGAFEHFGRVGQPDNVRRRGYRHFFERCHDWLEPGGKFSLQTIAFGNMPSEGQSAFLVNEIYPASELPTLADIAECSRGLFEINALRNDRLDYVETNKRWLHNLRKNRTLAESLVGQEKVEKYLDYLRYSIIGFHIGNTDLLRLSMQRVDKPRFVPTFV